MKSYNDAVKILKKSNIKISDQFIKSINSVNRICSENIYSNQHYPSADNSSVDGFAINARDTNGISQKKFKRLKIVGSISAGSKPFKKILKKDQAVEIMTGGILPRGTNSIIPIEKCSLIKDKINNYILVKRKFKKFENVRFKGSDFKKKDLLIKKNTLINPNHIMAFKALGVGNIKVKKKINIIFFSSGNEISENNFIPSWKIRNSNHHYIKSLKDNFLFNFKNLGILKDNDEKKFYNKLHKILKSKTNIIITSGGVSKGKFDFIPLIIKKFELSNFFKDVALRPGKPILFAKIKNKEKVIFGLPGNPMSSAACFRFFVIPYISNILGQIREKPIRGVLKNSFIKKKKFTRFAKSKLSTTKNGKILVEILKGQESFRIKSFIKSNIWALLPAGKSQFKKGDIVDCFSINHFNQTFI